MNGSVRRLAAGALIVFVACTGCSVTVSAKQTAPPTPVPDVAKVKTPATGARLPHLHQSPPAAYDPASPASDLTSAGRSFVAGVDGFCRSWYVAQKAAVHRYPLASQTRQFDRVEQLASERLDPLLEQLRPPASLAFAFTQFEANEHQIAQARADGASADPARHARGDDAFDQALVFRHGYARQLGAAQCDGLLPRAQWVAAARAAQRFDVTDDVQEACRALVTRDFLSTEWGHQPGDPMVHCRQNLQRHLQEGQPHNIRVIQVTGTEDLSAQVTFSEVPECGCGAITVHMFFERGRWLVASVSMG